MQSFCSTRPAALHSPCLASTRPCSSSSRAMHVQPCLPRTVQQSSRSQQASARRSSIQSSPKRWSIRPRVGSMPGPSGGLSPEFKRSLDEFVNSHKVVVFMKGNKQFPQCGFSNTVVQILRTLNADFETVNVLENEMIRVGMKEYSQWPTFPQVYIDGEFYGGCDIMIQAFQSGELQETLEMVANA